MAGPNRLRHVSDRELVTGALVGSLEAYDELVRRFRGGVLLVAGQTLGSHEAAEDVAQDVFLQAFRELPQLRDPAKFPAWLHAITRHRARRIAMRDCRHRPTETETLDRLIAAHSGELVSSPAEELLRKEAIAAVRARLAALPPEVQAPMTLYYYEQWPVARIAEFLSLTLTTVKWRLHTGRRQLGRELARFSEEAE